MKLPNISINTFANIAEMANAFSTVEAGLMREKFEDDSVVFKHLNDIEAENKVLADYNEVLVKRAQIADDTIVSIYMKNYHSLVNIWDELKTSSALEFIDTPAGNQVAFMTRPASNASEYQPEFGYGVTVADGDAHVSIFVVPGVAATNYMIRVKKEKVGVPENVDEMESQCKEFVGEILRMHQDGEINAEEAYKNFFNNFPQFLQPCGGDSGLSYVSACARQEFLVNYFGKDGSIAYIGAYQDVFNRVIKGGMEVAYTFQETDDDADIIAEHQAKEAEESQTPVKVSGEQAIGRGLREVAPVTRTIGISEGNTLSTKRVERSDPAV